MKLAQLQAAMSGYLADNAPQPLPGDMTNAPGLAVYRHTYRAQLLACLRDTYEMCWTWLGDDRFDTAANAHIDTHPPASWTLDAYGTRFAQTLRTLHPEDPEIAELAWLDQAMRRAFDGHDTPPLDRTTLANLDWDNTTFTFVPTLQTGTATTNAAAIWTALANNQTPPPVAPLDHPATIVVWRQNLTPSFRTVTTNEATLLRLALNGLPFGAMCAHLADDTTPDEAAAAAGSALGQWLHDDLISSAAV